MARARLVALLAATAFGVFGVDAAVCRPSSSTVSVETSSTASFSSATASSTVSELSSTETQLSSTTASTASELSTASTSELLTTSTTATSELPTSTTATSELPTSTSEAITTTSTTAPVVPPPCRETQVLSNPSFDDNSDGSPWQFGTGVSLIESWHSSPYAVIYRFSSSGASTLTQSLTNVPAGSYKLTYEAAIGAILNARGVSCVVTPSINGQSLSGPGGPTFTDSGPFGWPQGTAYWNPSSHVDQADLTITVTCNGNFISASILVENASLTRVCVF
ncbi:hypothetical protein N0V84_007414 [Fusarium piperis]|uniref:Uncharacterized protein n=1 Tax=Fusarium piperis TaxID=1435070 RepID=A0A9W8WA26_9HYPO|nr:hypothetical protein N0V84_007414 [Fusarium piperis]